MYYFLKTFLIVSRLSILIQLFLAHLCHTLTFHSAWTQRWIERKEEEWLITLTKICVHSSKRRFLAYLNEYYNVNVEDTYRALMQTFKNKRRFNTNYHCFGTDGNVEQTLDWLLERKVITEEQYEKLQCPANWVYLDLSTEALIYSWSTLDLRSLIHKWETRFSPY